MQLWGANCPSRQAYVPATCCRLGRRCRNTASTASSGTADSESERTKEERDRRAADACRFMSWGPGRGAAGFFVPFFFFFAHGRDARHRRAGPAMHDVGNRRRETGAPVVRSAAGQGQGQASEAGEPDNSARRRRRRWRGVGVVLAVVVVVVVGQPFRCQETWHSAGRPLTRPRHLNGLLLRAQRRATACCPLGIQ